MKKILSLTIVLLMLAGALPLGVSVSARDLFDDPYAVVIEGGTAVYEGRNDAFDGTAQDGEVLIVTADEVPGRVFEYWRNAEGDVIPDATYRVLIHADEYVSAHYTDTYDSPFGEWETYYESHDCEIPTVLRCENGFGDVEFSKIYMNYGQHDVYFPRDDGTNYANEFSPTQQEHYGYCRICDKRISAPHEFDEGEIIVEPTHTEEGEARFTCAVCGYSETESVPPTEEHKWGDWTVVTPAAGGYGVRSRACVWCGATEECLFLEPDLKDLWTNHYMNYYFNTLYGGSRDERYYSYTEQDGTVVYVFASQMTTTNGRDNDQTFVYMYRDDGDPTTYEPVYMTKSGASSSSMMESFKWAPYDYVRDFDGFVEVIRHPDGVNVPDITQGNGMSGRGATLPWRIGAWADEVNNANVPATTSDVPAYLGYEVYETNSSYGGFEGCTNYRKRTSEWGDYNYILVDNATGVTVRKSEEVSRTTSYFRDYKDVVDAATYATLTEDEKALCVCADDIASEIMRFSQGRIGIADLTLEVPDPYTAVRVQVDRSVYNSDFTVTGKNWDYSCYSTNVAGVHRTTNSANYPNQFALTFTWNEDNSYYDVFDYWEVFNFETREWDVLSYDPVMVINTYSAPLTDLTVIRPAYHTENYTCYVSVEGGWFCYAGDYEYVHHNNESVTVGSRIYFEAGEPSEGMVFSHFRDEYTCEEYDQYYEYVVSGDMILRYEEEPIEAWVTASVPYDFGGFVSIEGYEPDGPTWSSVGPVSYGDELTLVAVTDTDGGYTDADFAGWFLFWWDELYNMERRTLISTDLTTTVEITEESPVYYAIWNSSSGGAYVEPMIKVVAENGFVARRPEGGMIIESVRGAKYEENELKITQNSYSAIKVTGWSDLILYDDPTDNIVLTSWYMTYYEAENPEEPVTQQFEVYEDEFTSYYIYDVGEYLEDSVITFTGDGTAPITFYPGDLNGDEKVNVNDLKLMKKLIVGALTETDVVIANADLNADGKITAQDLGLMKKLIASGHTW